MIEFITQMTPLDILFIVLWLGALGWGIVTGIIRQMLVLASILAGAILGSAFARPASFWTGAVSGAGEAILPFTYTFIVLLTAALVYTLTLMTYPVTRLGRHRAVDTIGGAVMGWCVGLVGVLQIVAMLLLMTDGQWAIFDAARASVRLQLESTPFLQLIADTFPHVSTIINDLLPKS